MREEHMCPFVLSSGPSVPLLSLKSLSQKVAKSSLMQADRLRVAKTLSFCFLKLRRDCHCYRSKPIVLPSYLVLLYVFPCSEHLTKDNLFGRLMLWHCLAQDYMRWPSDLWWLVVGWVMCVSARGERRSIKHTCASVFVSVSVWVCVQFQFLALAQTRPCTAYAYIYDKSVSVPIGRHLFYVYPFFTL